VWTLHHCAKEFLIEIKVYAAIRPDVGFCPLIDAFDKYKMSCHLPNASASQPGRGTIDLVRFWFSCFFFFCAWSSKKIDQFWVLNVVPVPSRHQIANARFWPVSCNQLRDRTHLAVSKQFA